MANQDTAPQQAANQPQGTAQTAPQQPVQQPVSQSSQQQPQQPAQQATQPPQQTVSVGGTEGVGQVEVQQSTEAQGAELPPQIQQVVQSAQQKQQQARQAKAQGDYQAAVAKNEEVLQEISALDKNQSPAPPQAQPPVQQQTTTQTSQQPQETVSQPQSNIPTTQQKSTLQNQSLPNSSQQIAESKQKQPAATNSQSSNIQQPTPPKPSLPEQTANTPIVQPQSNQPEGNESDQSGEETMSETDRKAAELLKGVETKYGHLTLDKPSSDGTIRATTDPQSVPHLSPSKPEDQGASHDGFSNVKVVSEPTGTIDVSHKQQQEEKGAFHRKLTQAPEPKQPKPPEKPAEKLVDPTEPVESGQKAAVSLLDAIVKRLESEEEKNLDKLTVSDSEEASYRFMEEGVLRAVTNRIKTGEWANEDHLDMLATKLGYFAAIDVLRDLKKQALDDKSQQTIQQAIDFLMNEHDQIEISEAQETMQAQAG